ncbi:hypothetical protein MJL01_24020, partial [Salmonella enterica subsp. enterica serovar Montevideo]|nr:hypothetical protein [Salmonella enterica subsp. enterica serovar Montevideo]
TQDVDTTPAPLHLVHSDSVTSTAVFAGVFSPHPGCLTIRFFFLNTPRPLQHEHMTLLAADRQ